MNARNLIPADRLVRPGRSLAMLTLSSLLAATVVAAPPTDAGTESPPTADDATLTDNPMDPNTDQFDLLLDDPDQQQRVENLFDGLDSAENPSNSSRYKYSVRYTDGNRRKLETVRASSEPLAYRKVREKHPEADSIILIEVRRDGERVDRGRRERKSGKTISNPLSGRRSNRKRFDMLGSTPEVPDTPFAKLFDSMHKQNIQNILRGKTFQDLDSRMKQAWIELQQRRQAAASQQASGSGSSSSGSAGGKTTFSKGNTHKRRLRRRICDSLKQDGGAEGGSGSNPGDTGSLPGEGNQNVGTSGFGQAPVSPDF